jgi:two-component system, sensor histidine kinase and response regulator
LSFEVRHSSAREAKPLVLIVDDEAAVRRLLVASLRDRFEVMEAATAAEALEAVRARDVEVVVSDVMMPAMSGLTACPLLKAAARGPLPVLLLTALDDQQSRNAGLEAGADDYLTKPIDRRELVLRVQNFVKLGRQERLIRTQLESLSQLQALKDDLTALVVHDLRNPLTAVRSAFQLLAPHATEKERPLIDLGRHAVDRVMDGIGDLLKVRMLEKGHLTLARSRCALDQLAHETVHTLHAAAIDRHVEVSITAIGDVEAEVDQPLLRRALENLLINAFRHTRERVDLAIEGDAERMTLSVGDRGPGVPDYLKGELFDMFGSLKLKQSGTRSGHGLGLYLVKLVSEAHGGNVVVKDREGGGAAFVITLPRAVAASST